MDTIAQTPRNRFLAQIADALLAADAYTQKADPAMPMGKANPPLALASQFLGLGGLARTADRLSYGEPITNLGKANVPLLPSDTADAIGAVGPVTGAAVKTAQGAKKVALALADAGFGGPVGKSAQRGAIRVGGDPSLMPSHETSTENLARTLNNGTMELYSPSIGIKKEALMSGFSGGGVPVNLIPKVGAYDPQNSVSTLFNRDAYTPRWRDYPGKIVKDVSRRMEDLGGTVSQASGAARDRLDDRLYNHGVPEITEYLKGAEGGRYTTTPDKLERVWKALGGVESKVGQAVSIADSPAFRSFEHYENSPLGAKLLKNQPDHIGYENVLRAKTFQGPFADLEPSSMHQIMRVATEPNRGAESWTRREMENTLRTLAEEEPGLEDAMFNTPAQKIVADAIVAGRQLRQGYRRSPSEYGELKVSGPTPITQENWAGAVVEPMGSSYDFDERMQRVLQALIDSGVTPATPLFSEGRLPFNHPNHPLNTDKVYKASNPAFDLADILQRQSGPARKQPINPR